MTELVHQPAKSMSLYAAIATPGRGQVEENTHSSCPSPTAKGDQALAKGNLCPFHGVLRISLGRDAHWGLVKGETFLTLVLASPGDRTSKPVLASDKKLFYLADMIKLPIAHM